MPTDELEAKIVESIESFIGSVTKTSSVYEMLYSNGLPQRCLRHNNILTLYCESDRMPICVSCLYHGTEHKSHKIVPLKNANKSLNTDTQNLRNRMQKRIEKVEEAIRTSTENLVKIERIYPELCKQIELNFSSLYEVLKRKELEQLRELYERTERLRSNHLVAVEEYNRLICFFIEKDSPGIPDDEDSRVFSRNILSSLLDNSKYLEIEVKPIDIYDYPQSGLNVFKEIESFALEKLETSRFPEIIVLGGQKVNLDQSIRLRELGKERTRSRARVKTPEHSRSPSSSFKVYTPRQENREFR